jgi:hypothetical protein
MKRILALTAVLALVAFAAVAGAQGLISGTLTGTKISATATNTTTTFSTASGASTGISIYNAGTNEVFVAINAAATTSSTEIPAGSTLTLTNFAATSLGVICSTDETSTVYLYTTAR